MNNPVWWADPGNLLIFLILPLFVVSAILGGPLMPDFGSVNFLTTGMIALGTACVGVMAVGAKTGTAAASRVDGRFTCFDPGRYDHLLVVFVIISLLANLLLLGPLLADPDTVLSVLRAEQGAIYDAKARMGWLVGVTSLTNITPLVACMCSLRFVLRGSFLPTRGWTMAASLLVPLIFVHAFIGSERLVLVENGIAFLLPLISFWPRLRGIARYVPLFGAIAVVFIFAVGEYLRTWASYSQRYDSFVEFASQRLLAYVAVASNTGAGMATTMPPVGYPLITARWYTQLPWVDKSTITYQGEYFKSFGNIEFNNPSGIMAAVVDLGVTIGLVYIFFFGILLGSIYALYRNGHAVGLLAYPIFFIGLVDLTQIWYWGEPRFIPRLVFLVLAVLLVVRRQVVARAP